MLTSETNPCGASLSARCFNGAAGCVTHPNYDGPYGVANWRAPLSDFERCAGVLDPAAVDNRPTASDQAGGA